MLISLAKQQIGVKSEIKSIEQCGLSNKLVELGFLIGQTVEVVFTAPFGDPIAIELNGSVLSLRLEEAANIQVENVEIQSAL
jgi:Fe2+ transport system protein FeoA